MVKLFKIPNYSNFLTFSRNFQTISSIKKAFFKADIQKTSYEILRENYRFNNKILIFFFQKTFARFSNFTKLYAWIFKNFKTLRGTILWWRLLLFFVFIFVYNWRWSRLNWGTGWKRNKLTWITFDHKIRCLFVGKLKIIVNAKNPLRKRQKIKYFEY